ncbi:phage protein NinX family protein [Klebsiella pneumoniae]
MDYSKLSDFEINRRVFSLVMNGRDWNRQGSGVLDFCNNPDDAWPIITSNRIGIVPGTATDKWAAHHGDWDIAIADVNPLRAAMIIFLMMQDSRKSPS